jgi:hypothetical protein
MPKRFAAGNQKTNRVVEMQESETSNNIASPGLSGPDTNPYEPVWKGIRQVSPSAVLLRGPACLNPIWLGSDSGGDIDVLAEDGTIEAVRAFLREQGFHRVFKPHAYLERYRRWTRGDMQAHTVDLFKREEWGQGYRRAKANGSLPDARMASLLHAIVDGKGTARFEREHHGPPWQGELPGIGRFGLLGRALWRLGSPSLLTGYLMLTGAIRPDPAAIFTSLFRRAAYLIWKLRGRVGMEIAFLGVDGAGKTSVASALLRLPVPVKIIYIYLGMGEHDYRTAPMRFIMRHNFPPQLKRVLLRFDLLVRRVEGWLFSRRGWIVVYDRHPFERVDPRRRSLTGLARNLLNGIYAWRVDWTFWLTGDYQAIYLRKGDYPVSELQMVDERYRNVLKHYNLPNDKIDVTREDLQEVISIATGRVLELYKERVSIDRIPNRVLRAAFE